MNCNRKDEIRHDKIEISVHLSNVVLPDDFQFEDIQPEFSTNQTSKAKSIQEWLIDAIENDKPKMPIGYFHFGFLDAGDHYRLIMVGLNISRNRIDYEPSIKSINLQKIQYENLDAKQAKENVKTQLKTFTETEIFKNSFFAQAESIGIDSDQNTVEIIWTK